MDGNLLNCHDYAIMTDYVTNIMVLKTVFLFSLQYDLTQCLHESDSPAFRFAWLYKTLHRPTKTNMPIQNKQYSDTVRKLNKI